MFTLALAALVAASSVAAVPSARFERNVHRSVPAQFNEKRSYAKDADLLEPYADYNKRYMEFNCPEHHNSEFFDLCCHPQLKTNITNEWPDQCYADCDEDDGGNDGEESAPATIAPKTTSHASAPAKTSAPANVAQSEPVSSAAPAKPTSSKIVTSTKKAEPTSSASSGGSSGGSWNTGGQATFFYQGGNPGACGTVHSDSDKVIAIQSQRYGASGSRSATCGRQIEIVNIENGKSVVATVADECPTCEGTVKSNSLDLSVGAFTALASESAGVVQIKWKFIS